MSSAASPVGSIEYGLATVLAALASARAALTGLLLRRELR